MYIEDCLKKDLFGTFERAKMPNNISDYRCELCIEEYASVLHPLSRGLFQKKLSISYSPPKLESTLSPLR